MRFVIFTVAAFVFVLGGLPSYAEIGVDGPPVWPVEVVNFPAVQDVNVVGDERVQMEFVEGSVGSGDLVTVFTVPEDYKFVLTDAFFAKSVGGPRETQGANVRRGDGLVDCTGGTQSLLFRAFVKAEENVALHFQTGYEFAAGEHICYQSGVVGDGTGVHFSLVGYLTAE